VDREADGGGKVMGGLIDFVVVVVLGQSGDWPSLHWLH
jgi:hypothetical protein